MSEIDYLRQKKLDSKELENLAKQNAKLEKLPQLNDTNAVIEEDEVQLTSLSFNEYTDEDELKSMNQMPLPNQELDLNQELLENQDPYDLRSSIQVKKTEFPNNKAILNLIEVPGYQPQPKQKAIISINTKQNDQDNQDNCTQL